MTEHASWKDACKLLLILFGWVALLGLLALLSEGVMAWVRGYW
jgi:hypothetical protein